VQNQNELLVRGKKVTVKTEREFNAPLAMEWVEPARLADYDFPPADRELIQRLGRQRGA